MFGEEHLPLPELEYSALKPPWTGWENMAAKALHHTPHRTTAPISFLQAALLRKPVGVCM